MLREQNCVISTLSNLLRFVNGPGCGLFWWVFPVSPRRMRDLLYLVEAVYRLHSIHLVDGVLSSVSLPILPAASVYAWWRGIKVSNSNNGFVCVLPIFATCSLALCCRHVHIKDWYVLLESWPHLSWNSTLPWWLFLLWSLLCLKITWLLLQSFD